MRLLAKMTIAAAATVGGALWGAAPANAQVDIGVGVHLPGVHVGVGVGAPAYYYGPGYYPPGPCDGYSYYYEGDCGYAVYNGPIELEGVAIGGPHYYRWFNGRPMFWYRGGWHDWNGWTRVNFGWEHSEGWGWHGGRWDRGWGNDYWHGGDRGREVRDFHGDHGDRDVRDWHDDYRGRDGRDYKDDHGNRGHRDYGEDHRGR